MKGSISSGTLNPRDLIPRFAEVLTNLAPDEESTPGAIAEADLWVRATKGEGDAIALVKTRYEHLTLEELGDCVLEDLFELLDYSAPAGTRFGAHPNDGADFGFWYMEDGT